MKKKHILFLLFSLMGATVFAQSAAEAKSLYEKGEYAQAKPALKKLVKSQPANGNYNLWYGVCCLKTGEASVGLKYLENAVKRRVPSGQLYLGQAYNALYRFEEAIETYEAYIADLTKRKRPSDEAEALLEQSRTNLRMLKGVEQICVIDSIVVDKAHFLDNYYLSPEAGCLSAYSAFFGEETGTHDGTVYETELGNKIYYGTRQASGQMNIWVNNKMLDGWGKPRLLPQSINGDGNTDYPYLLTDGITIYFASDGAESGGGYDIFVTRYNSGSESYLTPENVGMPFNSPYNDYMYAIDEFNNLGWFASDRNQPAGKVCIYIFIPVNTKKVYDYDSIDRKQLIRLAQLHSIRETWTDTKTVEAARQRLYTLRTSHPKREKGQDFEFIIDGQTTYYHWSDFRSAQAKSMFERYCKLQESLRSQSRKLEELRTWYTQASKDEKNERSAAILDLEKRIRQLYAEIEEAGIQVRQLEKSNK